MLTLVFIYMFVVGLMLSVVIALTPYVIILMAGAVLYQIVLKP